MLLSVKIFKKVSGYKKRYTYKNKYGTRTGVPELMCDQLDGDFSKKNAAKRDNAGAVCNSGMGMLFFMYLICLH